MTMGRTLKWIKAVSKLRTKMKRFLFILLTVIHPSALFANSEWEVRSPLTTSTNKIGKNDVAVQHEISINSRQTDRGAFRISGRVDLTIKALSGLFQQEVMEAIPKSSCSRSYLPHSFRVRSQNGKMIGSFYVRFRQRVCTTIPYPCFRGWKTYTCKKKLKTDVFQKTFPAEIPLTASLNDRGDLSLNTGAVNIGQGSGISFARKLVSTFKLDDIFDIDISLPDSSPTTRRFSIEQLGNYLNSELNLGGFVFEPSTAYFSSGENLIIEFTGTTSIDGGRNQALKEKLIEGLAKPPLKDQIQVTNTTDRKALVHFVSAAKSYELKPGSSVIEAIGQDHELLIVSNKLEVGIASGIVEGKPSWIFRECVTEGSPLSASDRVFMRQPFAFRPPFRNNPMMMANYPPSPSDLSCLDNGMCSEVIGVAFQPKESRISIEPTIESGVACDYESSELVGREVELETVSVWNQLLYPVVLKVGFNKTPIVLSGGERKSFRISTPFTKLNIFALSDADSACDFIYEKMLISSDKPCNEYKGEVTLTFSLYSGHISSGSALKIVSDHDLDIQSQYENANVYLSGSKTPPVSVIQSLYKELSDWDIISSNPSNQTCGPLCSSAREALASFERVSAAPIYSEPGGTIFPRPSEGDISLNYSAGVFTTVSDECKTDQNTSPGSSLLGINLSDQPRQVEKDGVNIELASREIRLIKCL